MSISRRSLLKSFGAIALLQNTSPALSMISTKNNASGTVGAQLILAMDISGSMNSHEVAIQLKATGQAIASELFRNVVKYKQGNNSIALSVISFNNEAKIEVPWARIDGKQINHHAYDPSGTKAPDILDTIALKIQNLPLEGSGATNVTLAMDLAKGMYGDCPWHATEKLVLDVFGDGLPDSYNTAKKRDELAHAGITINGFAMSNEVPELKQYYEDYLVTRDYIKADNGMLSAPGRVWSVSDMEGSGLKAYYNNVLKGMKQKLSVEVASHEDYERQLIALQEVAAFPVPPKVLKNR